MKRLLIAAASSMALLAGCSTAITGTPTAEGFGPNPEFDKLLQECTAVPDDKIAETVQADAVFQYFFGAVCMWDGTGPSGIVDVTFAWFENNSLGREKTLAEEVGYTVEDASVAGATAFLSRRPADPASCGITAAYSGTITWWVQYRSGAGDPCGAATRLAELTLQRNQ
ncbi:DUF3558 domain-containing protein [Rhodococcoides kyotonense]|uniref:DUF3558 domain-containing protein n=1 Tax=Rhodococcoides kyotonense TaxID=398843 RepID=A0A239HVN1_9NOCA|nr:DUF3558 domain-containing protein [Rhodococcus kyotonensis]SNS85377.1 Protein of unknown function [Rhodococcus kyotonensis]